MTKHGSNGELARRLAFSIGFASKYADIIRFAQCEVSSFIPLRTMSPSEHTLGELELESYSIHVLRRCNDPSDDCWVDVEIYPKNPGMIEGVRIPLSVDEFELVRDMFTLKD